MQLYENHPHSGIAIEPAGHCCRWPAGVHALCQFVVTPSLLGGSRIQVLAGSIYNAVTQTLEWEFAAAQAVILFVGVALVLVPYLSVAGRRNG